MHDVDISSTERSRLGKVPRGTLFLIDPRDGGMTMTADTLGISLAIHGIVDVPLSP